MSESLPRPAILSSADANWRNISLEYHRQPAHEMSTQTFPVHYLEVGLSYSASELKINGKIHQAFAPGNIVIHPANQPISVQSYGEAEFIAIALSPTFLDTVIPSSYCELIPQLSGQDPLILQLALALKQSLEQPKEQLSDSHFYADAIAHTIAAHLLQHYTTKPTIFNHDTHGLSPRLCKQVIDYIHAHSHQPITLSDMAAITGISSHYFATLFKQSVGISPYQYVIQHRIEQAKQLLAINSLTIAEICHRVGFQSQSHFTKVFRDRTKLTPKAYRNQFL